MTLSEIRDDFYRRYYRECRKKKIPPAELAEASIAMDISEVQQDIQRRLNVLWTYTKITTEAGKNTYPLPSNFGKTKTVMIGGLQLTEMSFNELIQSQDTEMTPNYFALYLSGNTKKIVLHNTPDGVYTVYVYYYYDLGYYTPSGEASQEWGKFDNNYFYGNLILPERYNKAIVYGMLANEFDHFELKYEKELNSLKESRVTTLPRRKYSLGGYKTLGTQMTVLVESTTSTSTTTGTSNINPDKVIRFSYSYSTGTVTIEETVGYEGTINGSSSGGVITISSSDPEFSINNLFIDINNDDSTFSNTSTQVTITPPANTNIMGLIYQWN